MFDELKREKLIVELKILLDKSEEFEEEADEDMDAYCAFMKDIIMSTSGLN